MREHTRRLLFTLVKCRETRQTQAQFVIGLRMFDVVRAAAFTLAKADKGKDLDAKKNSSRILIRFSSIEFAINQ